MDEVGVSPDQGMVQLIKLMPFHWVMVDVSRDAPQGVAVPNRVSPVSGLVRGGAGLVMDWDLTRVYWCRCGPWCLHGAVHDAVSHPRVDRASRGVAEDDPSDEPEDDDDHHSQRDPTSAAMRLRWVCVCHVSPFGWLSWFTPSEWGIPGLALA